MSVMQLLATYEEQLCWGVVAENFVQSSNNLLARLLLIFCEEPENKGLIHRCFEKLLL